MNKDTLRVVLVMVPLCAVLSLMLAVVNHFTSGKIEENAAKAEKAAYAEVADSFRVDGSAVITGDETVVSYIPLAGNSGHGYILNLKGKGYGGVFSLVASYKSNGELVAAKMLTNSETPGLGKKSEESWYMKMFAGKKDIPLSKSSLSAAEAESVSGASVTFSGVSKALKAGSDYVREVLK